MYFGGPRVFRADELGNSQEAPGSGKPTYPANLCPLFGCAELAGDCKDLRETVGDALKTAARVAVRQGAPEHLDYVLSSVQ
jgi:hypothetical protein